MLRKTIQWLFILALGLLLCSPLLLRSNVLPFKVALAGKENPISLPTFSLSGFWSGHVQASLANSFPRFFAARNLLIKSDNQINLSIFSDINASLGTRVLLGSQDYLYGKTYVDVWNKPRNFSRNKIFRFAHSLKRLQKSLRARGIAFVFLLSPSKAATYPEYIPHRWHHQQAGSDPDYRMLVAFLRSLHVSVLDGPRLFKTKKESSPFPLFAKGGTHWSYYASCMIAQKLILELKSQLKKNIAELDCRSAKKYHTPHGRDGDLSNLINVWDRSRFNETLAYPSPRNIIQGTQYRPRMFFVGTSYLWSVFRYLDLNRIHQQREMFYYYKKSFQFPQRRKVKINHSAIDWERDVFSYESIVIEMNEMWFIEAGFGFIKDALRHLRNHPEAELKG